MQLSIDTIVSVLISILSDASSKISMEDLYILINKVEPALEKGWITNLCQHLSVEIFDIYHFLNESEHSASKLDTTMLDEAEREEQWITAYAEHVGYDNP